MEVLFPLIPLALGVGYLVVIVYVILLAGRLVNAAERIAGALERRG